MLDAWHKEYRGTSDHIHLGQPRAFCFLCISFTGLSQSPCFLVSLILCVCLFPTPRPLGLQHHRRCGWEGVLLHPSVITQVQMAGCLLGEGQGADWELLGAKSYNSLSAFLSLLPLLPLAPPSGHQLRGRGGVGGETWDSIVKH